MDQAILPLQTNYSLTNLTKNDYMYKLYKRIDSNPRYIPRITADLRSPSEFYLTLFTLKRDNAPLVQGDKRFYSAERLSSITSGISTNLFLHFVILATVRLTELLFPYHFDESSSLYSYDPY